ncbi:MAG: hypothetical protein NZM40_04105 [Sphingomonadaceae bacterium]|uniref:hypothetical protein n=1 Tax=Thermaurantiacus sp. TaxID=2820283 RepID=UPI00298F03AD|nr:hypothetical protein [Thermaurantiacus sp.]MCS6986608.1 hypothetical protein [Sphingomonadaceae bacterium]MDW8414131.1 hypothetical protein [Thermaurantiacus sp.]
MSLLFQIESCLKATRVPPSRFGRDAVNDPRIVHDLRRGRQPGQRMQERLRAHIARLMAAQGNDSAGPGERR